MALKRRPDWIERRFEVVHLTPVDGGRAALELPGLPVTAEVIPSSAHGFFDYFLGGGAILAPWLFGFSRHRRASAALQGQGTTVLLYSLLTNYEWGVKRVLPFRTHLLLDLAGALFLASSPWLLGFRRHRRAYLVLGLFEAAITLSTKRRSGTE